MEQTVNQTATTPDLWLTSYHVSVPPGLDAVKVRARTHRFHQVAMSLFGEPVTRHGRAEKNILWRLEHVGGRWRILIQSTVKPTDEATMLPHVQVKPVAGLFDQLQEGTVVDYCIDLAAQRRTWNSHDRATRKRIDTLITSDQNIERWSTKMGPAAGLDIETSTLTSRRQYRYRSPKKQQQPQNPALWPSDLLTGRASITDTDQLRHAIRRGIGTRNTYGLGMLSVRPVAAPQVAAHG